MTDRLPQWLRRPVPLQGNSQTIESLLAKSSLKTVCEEAQCPNRSECWCSGTASFMVMGELCTRTCRFCSVKKGTPEALLDVEKFQLRDAVKLLGLKYTVITSVTRDDLPDGGSVWLADLCRFLKDEISGLKIEILTPDFKGDMGAVKTVLDCGIDLFAHNIEMVSRLHRALRPEAEYRRSLDILKFAADRGSIPVKTGCMVGLGETKEEVFELLRDIADTGADIVTLGQYLRPSKNQLKVHRYVTPEEFQLYAEYGRELGIPQVVSGPYVRSSYRAADLLNSMAVHSGQA